MPPHCVITGGAGGMGLAVAKIVGREQPVMICDLSQDRLDVAAAELEALGIDVEPVVCDVGSRASVTALTERSAARGTVASVIHAAGVSPSMAAAEAILRINALGTLHVNEAFHSLAGPGFAIVNVASMAAHVIPSFLVPRRRFRGALRDESEFLEKMTRACGALPPRTQSGVAYSISKRFVTWYCASQAARFGSRGARIVSVSPGSIDTFMGRLEEQAGSGALVKYAALKRFGTPEEIAEVLAFCASSKAGYLTGVDIACDGGVLAGMRLRDMIAVAREA